MFRLKYHPRFVISLFLSLCALGIWSMSEFFSHILSWDGYLYGALFGVSLVLLSLLMRNAEKDIRQSRKG